MAADGVLCVGRLYCDLIFTDLPRLPTLGTEVFAGGYGLHLGGGVYITAAYLAALGRRTMMAAMLPPPPFAEALAPELEKSGIALDLAAEGPAPQVTVALVAEGDRAFVSRRAGPPFPPFTAADLKRHGIGHLHIAELGTLLECPDLPDIARAAGATVSLDCGWDDAITAEAAAELIAAVDVFLPNEAEAERLASMGLPEAPAPLTVVKCGADGARMVQGGRMLRAPARATAVVDTTGAGDAFNAGFLDAWLTGAAPEACLAFANVCGAAAVRAEGGFGGLTDADRAQRPLPEAVVPK